MFICKSIDGVLFNKSSTELIQYPRGNERTSYKMPDSVTSIGNYAFSGCNSLTSITIPETVTSIGTNILTGCTSLITLTAPFNSPYNTSNNSYLRYYFGGTSHSAGGTIPSSLINVIVAEGTTALGNYTFSGCSSLTSITIPETCDKYRD